jgi:hypothetical protein
MRMYPLILHEKGVLENYVPNLYDFVKEWDQMPVIQLESAVLKQAATGHINIDGSSECTYTMIFTPWHPSFYPSIEPAVRDLVKLCVEDLRCITFSSCEGHFIDGETHRFFLRYISIVARSANEYENLKNFFSMISTRVNTQLSTNSIIKIAIEYNVVTSENQKTLPALDIIFLSLKDNAFNYFNTVESVYYLVLNTIRSFLDLYEKPIHK